MTLALTRRRLMQTGGAGLVLAVALPAARLQAASQVFAPDAFLRIPTEGPVTVVVPQAEMGQGILTGIAMLIAEELDIGLDQLVVENAPADDALYANPLFGFQATGGSTSIRAFWTPMREAGATARAMLVAAAAESWGVAPETLATDRGVIRGAGGRSARYGELAAKAAQRPIPAGVPLKDPASFRLIGTPAHRVDTAGKLDGSAQYGIDARPQGAKIAALAICPVVGGRLGSVDAAPALAVPGVRQVVRTADAVAVVADHTYAAQKGLAALDILWDEGSNAGLASAAIEADLAAALERPGAVAAAAGDPEAALAAAARRVAADYAMPFLAHAAMEPMNCTVHVRPDACEIWVGTQVQTRAKATAAAVTGLPPEAVTVHNHLIGGGFGRRLDEDGVTRAVEIARAVDGPVKVIWSREEDIQHDVYRPAYADRLAAGLDAQGRVTAFTHRVAGSSVLARWLPPAFKDGVDFDAVDGAGGPYAFPAFRIDYVRQEPPAGLVTGWWRGVGVTHNAFVVESFVDELALAAGQDPVAFRRGLLGANPRARGVLELAAEKAGWGAPLPPRHGRGVALIEGFGSFLCQVAEVVVQPDGQTRVLRLVSAVDCGLVVNPDTVVAQAEGGALFGLTAALYGEITFADGRVAQSNFHDYPALRIDETPVMETHIVPSREAPGGMGEPGAAAAAPAVANAIFAATGRRLRSLPVSRADLSAS